MAQIRLVALTARLRRRGLHSEEHGHRRVDQMKREHVDLVIGKLANKPGAGIILLKRMRTLIRYAMAIGWTDHDPTAGGNSETAGHEKWQTAYEVANGGEETLEINRLVTKMALPGGLEPPFSP